MKKPRFNRIKAVLADKGIANKELAEGLGVTEGTVSTWCQNVKQPKIETLFVIAKFLQMEASELLNTTKGAGV